MVQPNNFIDAQSVVDPATMIELEAIDMSLPEEEIIPKLMNNVRTVGFFSLTNVEGFDEAELFNAVKSFYKVIPEEERRKLIWHNFAPEHENYYRGLTPFVDNDPAHKEMYDMGGSLNLCSDEAIKLPLYEDTPFPPQEEYKWIKKFFSDQYNRSHALSMKLLEYLAIGLGKDRYIFHQWFEQDSLSTYRAIHILPRSAGIVNSSSLSEDLAKLTTPAHCDSGFITILSTLGYPGLQVEIDGEFKNVKPVPNQLVVNLGDIFSRITNFELKATKHRVLDIGIERFSSPFFLEPKYTACIPSNMLKPEAEQAEPPIVFGEWIVKKLQSYAEWQGFVLPDRTNRYRNSAGEICYAEAPSPRI